MRVSPWFRCPKCDKVHVLTYASANTACSCGENLFQHMFENQHSITK